MLVRQNKNIHIEVIDKSAGRRKKGLLTSCALMTGLLYSGIPLAHAEGITIEEITVTAQKREQNLQDVPISISVTTGDAIRKYSIENLHDLSTTMPGVQVAETGPGDSLFIRGVGSGDNSAFEQSVGTFIDGIYHGRARMSKGAFMDLERIEVLKGPQNLFFGNNSIAGAFSLTTRKPGDSLEGYASVFYAPNHGEINFEAATGGPLTDTLGARIAVRRSSMSGYIQDINTKSDVPNTDDTYGRITLVWSPVDNFDATLKAELGSQKRDGSIPVQLTGCPPAAPFTTGLFCAISSAPESTLDKRRSESGGQLDKLDTRELALTMNYENWGHSFTTVFGYVSYDFNRKLDTDLVPENFVTVDLKDGYDQYSGEFRIASQNDGPVSYMVGAYWQKSDLEYRQPFNFFFLDPLVNASPLGPVLGPFLPLGQTLAYDQNGKTISAFASLTWEITDDFRTTFGGRWSRVKKDFFQNIFFGTATEDFGGQVALPDALQPLASLLGLGVASSNTVTRTDKDFTPSVNVQYDVSENAMVYASFTQGFKAGGFDGQNLTGIRSELPFNPESVNGYEVGLKSTWFDRAVIFNLSFFLSKYKNLQVGVTQQSDAAILFSVDNAGSSTSQGMELETKWNVNENLSLGLNFSWLDSFYSDYKEAGCTALQNFLTPMGQACSQDLSGKETTYAPDYSGNFSVQYDIPISSSLDFSSEVSLYFSDGYFVGADNDPAIRQGAYAKLDGRITIADSNGRWEVSVVGKNLTDKTITSFANDVPATPGSYLVQIERPRSIGVQGRVFW